ncbi:hypothetical protein JF544_16425 [Halobacillus kuroshimensis]|uniref:Uncharacterized protein n=1 Tax=Halobacillus kuroshimensis TaxID=302481 RepID=A0ABS3DZR9_9BACI|nr:hypothetical protein [Halobacillus kuroshimensis]MBN8236845.1 hypothetical protein [Halobacillus kuroshimensis]
MQPRDKKLKIIEEFNKKKIKNSYNSKDEEKDFISFKDLDIKFYDETFKWHRKMNGGAEHDENLRSN